MLGSYEQVTSSTGTVNKIYIEHHTLIIQTGATFTPSYLLRDHLGSLIAVADKACRYMLAMTSGRVQGMPL